MIGSRWHVRNLQLPLSKFNTMKVGDTFSSSRLAEGITETILSFEILSLDIEPDSDIVVIEGREVSYAVG